MTEHVSSIPQLWSSSLQETRTQMQSQGQSRVPDTYDNRSPLSADPPIPILIHGNAWPRRADSTQMKALMKTRPFQYIIATMVVFILSLLLLIAIQPPFTFSAEDGEKHTTRKFSIAKASIYSLGATGVGFAIATGMYVFSYRMKAA